MAFDPHGNLAYGTVATAPSPPNSGTTLTLAVGQGATFPNPGAIGYNATVWPPNVIPLQSNAEIVRITAVVGDQLTITRTQEGSTAKSILTGWQIAATITAKVITDIENAIPSTAGLLSAVNISAGTTSRNLSALTFANASGVSFGLNGSVLTATVQTNYQSPGAYLTTAALSQDSSKYAGTAGAITGGSLTVNTSGVSIALPAYLTTAMRSDAVTLSNINVSAGTTSQNLSALTFSNSNGLSFGLNGSTLTGSYTVPTVTAGSDTLGISNFGNTSGTSGVVSGDSVQLILAGGNNITLSQSINGRSATVTISGPNVGGAQTGISGVVVSNTTFTSGTVSLSAAGAVTISSSANGATQYAIVSVAAQSTQSAIKGLGVSNVGQTAGNTGLSTGIDWVLAGSQSITLSQSTQGGGPDTIWIQHPAWLTTAMQSNAATISNINVSAGTTSQNLSNVIFSNSNGLAFGLSGSTITGSYTVPTVTHSSWTVSDAATSGTVARLAFTNLNGVTLSLSTGAGGSHTIVGSVATSLTNVNLSAGTTSQNLSAFVLSNSNNVSFGLNGSTVTATASFAQSNQTLGLYATGNTTGQSTSSTFDARSITFSGAGNISVGMSGSQVVISGNSAAPSPVNFSAGTTSNNLGTVVFSNSNGVSFGLSGSTITGTVSTYSTVGTATTVSAVASANSVGTVTRWAAEDHAHAGVGGIGISTQGNTAGTTGSVVGTYWHQGSGDLTLSQITSNNGSHTLVLSVRPVVTLSQWSNIDNYAGMVTGASGITQTSGSSIFVQPFFLDVPVSASYLRLLASFNDSAVGTGGTTAANATMSVARYTTIAAVLYTAGVGASSRSIQSVSSTSVGITGSTQVGMNANGSQFTVTVAKTYPATGAANNNYTTSFAVSSASIVISSNSNTLFTGPRFLDIPFAGLFTEGNYWIGIGASTSSATNSAGISFAGTNGMPVTLAGLSQSNVSVGLLGAATSASDFQLMPGLGVWTTNSSGISTASMGLNAISQVVSNPQLPFQFIRQA